MSTAFRRIYVILGLGAITAFFGHAMWAVRGKDTFVDLVTGSFDNALGVSVGTDTATTIVRTIGYVDIAISVTMAVALIGFLLRQGALYRFALSPVMIGLYTWAVVWGFTTAASRMSGAGVWYPEVWDLVERGPNFLVPAALVVLTLVARREARERALEAAPRFAPRQEVRAA